MINLILNIMDERQGIESDIPTNLIESVLTGAYSQRGEMDGSVNIVIVDDDTIADMNESYLNHQGSTDVLAFDDGDIEEDVLLLGDIAVSADTARRVSKDKDMSYEEELTLYTLHGLLHLLGMDDKSDTQREEMMQAQESEFEKHGLKYTR